MEDDILQKILDFLKTIPEPKLEYSKDQLAFNACARETVLEIIERILDCPFNATEDILWRFILEMSHYSSIAQTGKAKDLFNTMCEIGVDLYYLIRG